MPRTAKGFAFRVQRFLSRVVVDAEHGGCWLVPAESHTPKGYAFVEIERQPGKSVRLLCHRLAWLILRGPIPEGKLVCHHCDNPGCVNPDHCFIGGASENQIDCAQKGRNPRALLNTEKVLEVRRLQKDGVRYRDIAATFGVKPQTIKHIIARRRWAYVEESHAKTK